MARRSTSPKAPAAGSAEATPAPKPRRALVENEILERATALFAERGYAGTSLQDIASATGLTRQALYYYVASKEEILERLVHQVTDDVADRLSAVAENTDLGAVDRLHQMVFLLADRQLKDPTRFRLILRSEAELPDEVAAAYRHGRRRVLQTLVRVIEDGIESDVLRPVNARTAALGVIGTCNWIAWWHRDTDGGDEAIATQFAEFAVAGLRQESRLEEQNGLRPALALLREDLGRLERAIDCAERDDPAR
jgi:AcrR family transcriptional regulator